LVIIIYNFAGRGQSVPAKTFAGLLRQSRPANEGANRDGAKADRQQCTWQKNETPKLTQYLVNTREPVRGCSVGLLRHVFAGTLCAPPMNLCRKKGDKGF